MEFTVSAFIENLARRLIHDFDSASIAEHSTLIGDARENPARVQLENILPKATKIGTGIIMDTKGRKSRQQDLVFYEGDYCPVFSINNTPSASFFPIEGVIASGEVKSSMSREVLRAAIENIKSVKSLERFINPENTNPYPFRQVNTSTLFSGAPHEAYDQLNKGTDQIFSFILCHKFIGSPESFKKNCCEFYKDLPRNLQPNAIISLTDGFLCPSIYHNDKPPSLSITPMDANSMSFCPSGTKGFQFLIEALLFVSNNHRSVPLEYIRQYIHNSPTTGYQASYAFPL